jgi:hypothetical protein
VQVEPPRGARAAQAVAVTITALAWGEWFTVRDAVIRALELVGVPLVVSMGDMTATVWESLRADPLTVAFWLLGTYAVVRVFGRARVEVTSE